MATIKKGICPSCGKNRELSYFQFGIVKSTMCVHCLKRYLDLCVIPQFLENNKIDNDECFIGVVENEK